MNYNYRIVVKSKKRKGAQRITSYKIDEPENWNLKIGVITLGKTLDTLPASLDKSNASMQCESSVDTLIINSGADEFSIRLEIDSPFISGLLKSGKFCFKFIQTDEDVHLAVFFKKLPMENSSNKFRIAVTQLFNVLHGVGDGTPSCRNLQKKIIDNMDNVTNAYQAIRRKQASLGSIDDPSQSDCQTKWLIPKLRPYQQQAVQWMLKKEANAADDTQIPHPSYVRIKLPLITVYFDQHSGNVLLEAPMVSLTSRGGILADEMGLGKTIEVLALILSDLPYVNPPSEMQKVEITRQRKRPTYAISNSADEFCISSDPVTTGNVTREALQFLYNRNVSSIFHLKIRAKPDVACICGSLEEKDLAKCIDCNKNQHKHCMGYKTEYGDYRCPQCWATQELVVSTGTLIVCPISLRQQWLNEIDKHVAYKLKVLNYEGSNILTPVYPTKLAQYDIVITTYNVLQTEFRFVDHTSGGAASLRHQRKYSSPGSPITFVRWKRLCLDEAQTVEKTATLVAEMAQRLNSDYRWAITGTPISVSIGDLYGLIEYLQLSPFDDQATFRNVLYKKYLDGDQAPLIDFLATVLWRTAKADVLAQINIPQQTVEYHYVDFSQVEQYFYDCETNESRNQFLEKLTKYDLNLPLISLPKFELNKLLQPVVSLRRVCVHHNVVNGRYLLTKKPVNSMQELLDALISRNLNEAEEHLRLIIAALNGLAGTFLLLSNPLTAAEHYVQIQKLESRYTAKKSGAPMQQIHLSIDKLPLIHMYYNLRQLLIVDPQLPQNIGVRFNEKIEFTVEQLKSKQDRLEHDYIHRFRDETIQILGGITELATKIFDLEKTMTHEKWYADIVAKIFEKRTYADQFGNRVNSILEDYPGFNFISREAVVISDLVNWVESLNTQRELAMTAVNDLFEIGEEGDLIVFSQQLLEDAADCHLRPDKSAEQKKEKPVCQLCQANKLLGRYGNILFSNATENKDKQFAWKPAEQAMILQATLKMAKHRFRSEVEAIQNGDIFMEVVELQKKEFKELRKEWASLDAQICAYDELALCKMRLKLKAKENNGPIQNRHLNQLSYEIRNNLLTINEMAEHEIEPNIWNLRNEWITNEGRLEKCIGTNNYLQSLHSRENSGQQFDPCPICRCQLENAWNLLRCGHAYCINCLQTMIGPTINNTRKRISCAVCRQVQSVNDISYFDKTLAAKGPQQEQVVVVGNCSSKVEQIVRLIKRLKEQEPDVKVLVFSVWTSALKVLRDIFNQNDITSVMLVSGKSVVNIVEKFKSPDRNVTVLLLPVNLGSKGLNLIEATHVIFAEPLLDPAEEQQAIGRVHRIGQDKPTVIHKFIMRGSIEVEIQRVTSAEDKSKWMKTEVTLQQLKDLLFASPESDGGAEEEEAVAPMVAPTTEEPPVNFPISIDI